MKYDVQFRNYFISETICSHISLCSWYGSGRAGLVGFPFFLYIKFCIDFVLFTSVQWQNGSAVEGESRPQVLR